MSTRARTVRTACYCRVPALLYIFSFLNCKRNCLKAENNVKDYVKEVTYVTNCVKEVVYVVNFLAHVVDWEFYTETG